MGLYSQATYSRNTGLRALNSTGARLQKNEKGSLDGSQEMLPKIGEVLLFKPKQMEEITKSNEKIRQDNYAFGDSSQIPLKQSLKYLS